MVTRRMAWAGVDVWARMSDKLCTELTDDSIRLTSGTTPSRVRADVIGRGHWLSGKRVCLVVRIADEDAINVHPGMCLEDVHDGIAVEQVKVIEAEKEVRIVRDDLV